MDAPSSLAFWARRQAHETAIHRADAESASGVRPEYEPEFAADGIDELIMGFGQRRKYRPSADGQSPCRSGPPTPATPGTSAPKTAAFGPAVRRRTPPGDREDSGPDSAGPAACTVTGAASGVYLFLWNRSDAAQAGVTISGDAGFLELWQSSVRVRWS